MTLCDTWVVSSSFCMNEMNEGVATSCRVDGEDRVGEEVAFRVLADRCPELGTERSVESSLALATRDGDEGEWCGLG
jgi:hypothetical protein